MASTLKLLRWLSGAEASGGVEASGVGEATSCSFLLARTHLLKAGLSTGLSAGLPAGQAPPLAGQAR
ncbi:MAG: hypothetical protein KBF37_04795 [Saprospiraceae bacterium]|nr:hypothetical protein [Saprospiraceae bacterium]